MKKTFGMIALLASSSVALVSPALAHDQQDNYGYRNQNFSHSYNQPNNRYTNNRSTTDENGYRNSYVVARDNDDRHNDRPDRESVRDRQWERRELAFRECR
jgi:hypothetical protein